jgi:hypothetical protein
MKARRQAWQRAGKSALYRFDEADFPFSFLGAAAFCALPCAAGADFLADAVCFAGAFDAAELFPLAVCSCLADREAVSSLTGFCALDEADSLFCGALASAALFFCGSGRANLFAPGCSLAFLKEACAPFDNLPFCALRCRALAGT